MGEDRDSFFKNIFGFIMSGVWVWAGLPAAMGRRLRLKSVDTHKFGGSLVSIDMEFWDPHYKYWPPCHIVMDTGAQEIKLFYSSDWLFNKDHKGSGIIGVYLTAVPMTLPLAPVLLPINGYYWLMEKICGMSRHSRTVFNSIKHQLDPEIRKLLKTALQKMWEEDRYFATRVSVAEAQKMLSQCHLREDCGPEADYQWQQYNWFDENGRHIGSAQVRDGYLDDCRVLGSHFEIGEAKLLFGCYKTKELIDHNKEREARIPELTDGPESEE